MLTMEDDRMKRLIAFVFTLVCVLGLVGCSSDKYTCRPLEEDEIFNLQSSSIDAPFVTDEERDELLNKAVENYLEDLGNESLPFTYEITDTHQGVYDDKETILYWLKIVYGEGFTTVMGFIIQ